MKAVKITDKIYWVGAIDWNIRDFHGYSTNQGTTYNAFLVLDKKTVLIDTVKELFYDEMKARLTDVLGDKKIDIIICNHAEMDHSGALRKTIADFKPQKVYASTLGVQNIKEQLGQDLQIEPLANGATLEIGEDSFTFLESRMLHWPDSMVALLNKENILFCNDIFGMHYACTQRFDYETNREDWIYEFRKYYANIILPYSKITGAFLKLVEQKGINPRMICPDHGVIWQKHIPEIIAMYKDFAAQKSKKKAIVVYDTMWGSTAKMAASVVDGLASQGVETKSFSLHTEHRSDIATEVMVASALIFGTPVINQEIFPSLGDITTYLKGLKKENLVGAAFGSYGWSASVLNKMEDIMKSLSVQIVSPMVKAKFVPDAARLKECFDLGAAVGKAAAGKFK
ncbi:MAG: FprA family A-type flavoprotein [Elusimicrobiota bacterium]|jgi:flavorubredoxin|nr:FprA family A-type flavoprotein [Elusimicrobiota bacterium]